MRGPDFFPGFTISSSSAVSFSGNPSLTSLERWPRSSVALDQHENPCQSNLRCRYRPRSWADPKADPRTIVGTYPAGVKKKNKNCSVICVRFRLWKSSIMLSFHIAAFHLQLLFSTWTENFSKGQDRRLQEAVRCLSYKHLCTWLTSCTGVVLLMSSEAHA